MNYENLFKAYKFFKKLFCRLQFIVNSSTSDSNGTKYGVDENANENNNDKILQWRFTAYL